MSINYRVLKEAYDFTIDIHGEIAGLTAGDHNWEGTGIFLENAALEIWKLGLAEDERKMKAGDYDDNSD